MVHNTIKPKSSDEPIENTVIVPPKPVPWYKRILRALNLTNDAAIYFGVIVFLVLGYFITRATLHWQGGPIKAGTNTVKISIQPGTGTMPPNTTFQVWATADNPVSFITLKIVFDPILVKMIGEVSTSPSPLTRIVKQTAMSEANTTGIVDLSFALDPTKKGSPATGVFELATIPMAANTTQNVTATLHLDSATMQVVNPDASLFTISTVDSSVSLNPPATPTPTPNPTATPRPTATPTPTAIATAAPSETPTPTSTPSATETLTPTPTSTPYPTSTPTPTPRPTNTPTPTPRPTNTPTPTPRPTATPTPTPRPTNTPTPTPKPTSTPTPTPITPLIATVDVVTIHRAVVTKYWWSFWRVGRLNVTAISSQSPSAQLTVEKFGQLRFNSSTNTYTGRFWVYGSVPERITVVSTFNGKATSFVSVAN